MALAITNRLLSEPLLNTQRVFSLRPWTLQFQPRRSYALSRFPGRRAAGVGRNRERINPSTRPERHGDPQPSEDIPSDDNSRLWHTAQRPPTSNSEEALKRLLLQNDTLIIERYLDTPLSVFFFLSSPATLQATRDA